MRQCSIDLFVNTCLIFYNPPVSTAAQHCVSDAVYVTTEASTETRWASISSLLTHHSILISVVAVEAVIIFVLLIALIVSAKHGAFYNYWHCYFA